MPFLRPLGGLAMLAALTLASCGGGSGSSNSATTPAQKPAGTTPVKFPNLTSKDFKLYAQQISSKGPVLAPSVEDLTTGTQRLGFGIFTPSRTLMTGVPVAVYVQSQNGGPVLGPFVAKEESLIVHRPYLSVTVAKDPDSAKGVFVAHAKFPKPGNYNVLGLVRAGGRFEPTGVGVRVRAHDPIPGVGDKPPLISTPTVQSVHGNIASIDTRTPHDDMHDVNFRDVIGKKPVVLLIATPLLCQSRVCGPVTDIAEEVKHTMPEAKQVAFIHQEVYNQNNANKGYRPQLRAFHLQTEPWAFVFNRKGVISTRLEGAFSASELEAAIRKAISQ